MLPKFPTPAVSDTRPSSSPSSSPSVSLTANNGIHDTELVPKSGSETGLIHVVLDVQCDDQSGSDLEQSVSSDNAQSVHSDDVLLPAATKEAPGYDLNAPMTAHELPNLDVLGGVRGLCAVLIVVGHTFGAFGPTSVESEPPFVLYIVAVTLFFIISGFTLMSIYGKRVRAGTFQQKEFLLRRCARVVPMYMLTLAFGAAVLLSVGTSSTRTYLVSMGLQALFLQSIVPFWNDNNGPLWQISAFMVLYVLFHVIAKRTQAWHTHHPRKLIVALVLVWIVCSTLVSLYTPILHPLVVFRVPLFWGGVLLAEWVCTNSPHHTDLGSVYWSSACMLVLWVTPTVLSTSVYSYAALDTVDFRYAQVWSAPLLLWWLAQLTHPSARNTWLVRVLSSRPLQKLGDLSLSIYCVHYPVIQLAAASQNNWLLAQNERNGMQAMFYLSYVDIVCTWGAVAALSWLLHVFETRTRSYLVSRWCGA